MYVAIRKHDSRPGKLIKTYLTIEELVNVLLFINTMRFCAAQNGDKLIRDTRPHLSVMILLIIFVIELLSVSYTHLDVYKRQGLDCPT